MRDPIIPMPPTFADLSRDGLLREMDAQRLSPTGADIDDAPPSTILPMSEEPDHG